MLVVTKKIISPHFDSRLLAEAQFYNYSNSSLSNGNAVGVAIITQKLRKAIVKMIFFDIFSENG